MAYQFAWSLEDARTKWCPFARDWDGPNIDNSGIASVNRTATSGLPMKACHCIASDCMAWRWVETHLPDDDGNLTKLSGDTHGYCGLAGPTGAMRHP